MTKLLNRIFFSLACLLAAASLSAQCTSVTATVEEVNCGIAPDNFMAVITIASNSPDAIGWRAPLFGYTQLQTFGTFSFVNLSGPEPVIEIEVTGDPACQFIFVSIPNDCSSNTCPLQLFVQDTTWADCGQSNGAVSFAVEGTVGDYQISYQSDNGQTGSVTNQDFIDGLPGGCYVFDLSDSQDFCSIGTAYCVPTRTDMTLEIIRETNNCADYALTALVTGGTAPYQYTWNNGDITQAIFVPEGDYRVTITDATGCTIQQSVSVFSNGFILQTDGPGVITNATCGQASGIINAIVTGGNLPLTYAWSDLPGESAISLRDGLAPGTYDLTVTDATGCSVNGSYVVGNDDILNVAMILDNEPFSPVLCEEGDVVEITASVPNFDTEQLTFEWTDESGAVIGTEPIYAATEAGVYSVTVNDMFSTCTGSNSFEVFSGQPGSNNGLEIVLFYNDTLFSQGCGAFAYLNYNGVFSAANWTVPGGQTTFTQGINIEEYGPGLYIASIYLPSGNCPISDSILILQEDLNCTNINGNVFLDENADCAISAAGEIGLRGQLVKLTSMDNPDRVHHAYTNNDGNWQATLPLGEYEVVVIAPNELFLPCPPQIVTAEEPNFTFTSLGLQPQGSCPRVTVDLNVPRIRRCFDSGIYLSYDNQGTAVSENTMVTVEVGDWADELLPFFDPQPNSFATDPVTGAISATWNVGDVAPFERGSLAVLAYTCNEDAPLNAAACVSATVSPNNPCPPADANWTGASIDVEGVCRNDSVVFALRNVGDGNMSIDLQYIVVEDGVIITPVPETDDPLNSGEMKEVGFAANGSTYHLRATQEPLHPGLLMPIDFVEGCGDGNTSLGFALQFPVSDDAYWIDEDCLPIIGAYDPNDKRAEPKGYGEQNYIVADQPIDYQIRFQNTGTDTAFTVVVRDTISELLNMSTFQLLSTTHDVKVSMDSSNAIAFIFEDIMLPDSFVNEPLSNGSISFRISPVADLAPGTEINNTASIYFDFNEAVVTNTYLHTVEEDFVAVGLFDFTPTVERLKVVPNPTSGPAMIELPAALEGETLSLEVIDPLGRVQFSHRYDNGQRPEVDLAHLPAGWYTLRLTNGRELLGTGRVLLQ